MSIPTVPKATDRLSLDDEFDRLYPKAGAIACVEHVIDIGLATNELKDWLAMLLESLLVGADRPVI